MQLSVIKPCKGESMCSPELQRYSWPAHAQLRGCWRSCLKPAHTLVAHSSSASSSLLQSPRRPPAHAYLTDLACPLTWAARIAHSRCIQVRRLAHSAWQVETVVYAKASWC